MNSYVLPEYWCVLNDDDIIGEWFDEATGSEISYSKGCNFKKYLHSHNLSCHSIFDKCNSVIYKSFAESFPRVGYTVISRKQFFEFFVDKDFYYKDDLSSLIKLLKEIDA